MSRIVSIIFFMLVLGVVGFVGLLLVSNPVQNSSGVKQAQTENHSEDNDNAEVVDETEKDTKDTEDSIISITKADIESAVQRNPELSTFLQFIKSADINETLVGKNFITIVAPSNEAFSKLPSGEIERLLQAENSSSLNDIVFNHIVTEELSISNVYDLNGKSLKNLNEQEIMVSLLKGQVVLNDSKVTDFESFSEGNIVIHIVDTIISV